MGIKGEKRQEEKEEKQKKNVRILSEYTVSRGFRHAQHGRALSPVADKRPAAVPFLHHHVLEPTALQLCF